MRFVIKIAMPTPIENPLVSDPNFEEKLTALFLSVGALEAYTKMQSERRYDYILVEIEHAAQMTGVAETIFRTLKVKSEFLPEVISEPSYGF